MKVITYLTGVIACLIIIFGAVLKIRHFAGGLETMIMGIALLLLVYLPCLIIYKKQKKQS